MARASPRPSCSGRAGARQSGVTGPCAADAYGAYSVEGPSRRRSLQVFLSPAGRREHMPRTRADLLDSYRSYLALQRDLSGNTVRA